MTVLKINESAVANNIRQIRLRTDGRIIAVIKENGYGIGLFNAYRILKSCGIDFFAVAHAKEALALRDLGCTDDILLLAPEFSLESCCQLLLHNIILMLGNPEQADLVKAASLHTKLVPRIHLAIDTGLGRYGFLWNHLEDVKFYTAGMRVEGCYTHFATASGRFVHTVQEQYRRFLDALSALSSEGISYGMTHVSASKAFLSLGDLNCDAVRIGSLLLGCCSGETDGIYQRAVWLESTVNAKTLHCKGEHLGYDGSGILSKDTPVGLVSAGYADGIFVGRRDSTPSVLHTLLGKIRRFFHRTYGEYVEIDGCRVPVLGKIGLNHMLLDLSCGDFDIGDTVRITVNPIFVPEQIPRIVEGSLHSETSTIPLSAEYESRRAAANAAC